jgi:hypothetical protein
MASASGCLMYITISVIEGTACSHAHTHSRTHAHSYLCSPLLSLVHWMGDSVTCELSICWSQCALWACQSRSEIAAFHGSTVVMNYILLQSLVVGMGLSPNVCCYEGFFAPSCGFCFGFSDDCSVKYFEDSF